MLIVEETTFDNPRINHIYYLSNDRSKMYGYQTKDGRTSKTFTRPLNFEAYGRSFRVIKRS